MDKWSYIQEISNLSSRYGDKLLQMMEQYNKTNLQEITLEEAKNFYEKIQKGGNNL